MKRKPRVTSSEGNLNFHVIKPLIKPIIIEISIAPINAGIAPRPVRMKSTNTIPANAKTEPTDRSNSPQIMSKDCPITTIPNQETSLNMLGKFAIHAVPKRAVNTTNNIVKLRIAADSLLAVNILLTIDRSPCFSVPYLLLFKTSGFLIIPMIS